jgi:hypothetical protein
MKLTDEEADIMRNMEKKDVEAALSKLLVRGDAVVKLETRIADLDEQIKSARAAERERVATALETHAHAILDGKHYGDMSIKRSSRLAAAGIFAAADHVRGLEDE